MQVNYFMQDRFSIAKKNLRGQTPEILVWLY